MSPRPILVSFEVPGLQPMQQQIAADGKRGLEGVEEALGIFVRMATGTNTSDPPQDVTIRITAAPLLDMNAELPDLFSCPSGLMNIFDHLLFFERLGDFGNNRIVTIWQLALIPEKWFQQRGFSSDIASLNLYLADFGLRVGMTREELPPGDDQPWNQEPYFVLPDEKQTKYSLFHILAFMSVAGLREKGLSDGAIRSLLQFLKDSGLCLGMIPQNVPDDWPRDNPNFATPSPELLKEVATIFLREYVLHGDESLRSDS